MPKPRCDECGSESGLVHVTQIVDDATSRHTLCEECAAAKGMQPPIGGAEIAGLVDQLLKMERSAADGEDPSCGFCGLSFSGFRSGGLLGCPECYQAFGGRIRSIVKRAQRAERHVGKVHLPPEPSAPDLDRAVEGLRRKLESAVRSEDFERAAELRDQLQGLNA